MGAPKRPQNTPKFCDFSQHNKEKGQGVPWATPNKRQKGDNMEQNWGKKTKMGLKSRIILGTPNIIAQFHMRERLN